jgi:hypothetical protein
MCLETASQTYSLPPPIKKHCSSFWMFRNPFQPYSPIPPIKKCSTFLDVFRNPFQPYSPLPPIKKKIAVVFGCV